LLAYLLNKQHEKNAKGEKLKAPSDRGGPKSNRCCGNARETQNPHRTSGSVDLFVGGGKREKEAPTSKRRDLVASAVGQENSETEKISVPDLKPSATPPEKAKGGKACE